MRILKSYGTDGGVLVNFSEIPEDVNLKEPVTIVIDGLPVPFFIEEIREKGSRAVIRFEDVDTLAMADALVGSDASFPGEPGSCWVRKVASGTWQPEIADGSLKGRAGAEGGESGAGGIDSSGKGCGGSESGVKGAGGIDLAGAGDSCRGHFSRPGSAGDSDLAVFMGFTILDASDGSVFGVVSDYYDIPGNPCLSVRRDGKEVLVPLHEDLVTEFKPRKKTITISIPVGLGE
jgi:ribosomal 30S subunit maturation factor RimM